MTLVRTSPTRRMARIAAAGLLTFGAFGYAVAPAGAAPLPASATAGAAAVVAPRHTALLSTVPADGAVLDKAPVEIVLTFNEKISPQYAQVVLSRDGSPLTIADPVVTGEVLRVALTDTTPGGYRIAYRVVSADGHPISGESRYTVKGVAATASASSSAPTTSIATSTPSAVPTATAGASASSSGSSTPQPGDQPANHVPGVLIGGGLVAVAAGLLWWDRRRRHSTPEA